ncbi:hypothetical protein C8F01DRAFT_1233905 [Mycena amicta]|nr:hypothetical protein C8F01DRAFT_1233905 [Mycena amicta]
MALQFNSDFWGPKLVDVSTNDPEIALHLVVSLIFHLHTITIHRLLVFLFTSDITLVKTRAARFLAYSPTQTNPNNRFPPSEIFALWLARCTSANQRQAILDMITPVAVGGVVADSNRVIRDPSLRVKISKLTIAGVRELLSPAKLAQKYRDLAPFFFELLLAFAGTKNHHRMYNMATDPDTEPDSELNDWEDDPNDDESGDGPPDPATTSWPEFEGFTRNPIFAIILVISMLAFVRNRATNLLPLILCLFFKISGTSTRVIQMLSNVGVCVSGRTAERLKKRLSDDAIALCVALFHSLAVIAIIFDNINLFSRKSQQRLTNQNSMIHATNVALFALEGADPKAEDLEAHLKLRGQRKNAKVSDILPTAADDDHMEHSFIALIAELLLHYCPGSQNWDDRAEMLKVVQEMLPKDRPQPPRKTDARPFGVFDVNEGSKKGIIELLDLIRERSTLSKEQWAEKVRVFEGDWLSANNLRNGRRIRNDDISTYERLEYVEEVPALFHFALQASFMILRLHLGNTINDPLSLSAHKGLLNRTWDVNKPNYAASKSLIRHSLIGRVLHCVMVIKGFRHYSQLQKWKPDLDDIQEVSKQIFEKFATSSAAEKAKVANDDYLARSIYFIRDALMFCKFEKSVSIADAGAVMRVLKYWALAFRAAGQHNYARECVEVLLHSKYEMTPELRAAREQAWFYNRWGVYGRHIAADLYLEQNNFWVKRVFIATGNGVTIEYIMAKGSACVEAFREISHLVANFFGDPDRARRHKEISFQEDLRALVENMVQLKAHVISATPRFVPAQPKNTAKKATGPAERKSAVVDAFVTGAQEWQNKFHDYLKTTTWDPSFGYPPPPAKKASNAQSASEQDDTEESPITFDDYNDLHGDEVMEAGLGAGALGGGDEFSTGEME